MILDIWDLTTYNFHGQTYIDSCIIFSCGWPKISEIVEFLGKQRKLLRMMDIEIKRSPIESEMFYLREQRSNAE